MNTSTEQNEKFGYMLNMLLKGKLGIKKVTDLFSCGHILNFALDC